ncbi:MAG: 50S ribosomal protein L3 [Candidatus Eiseniibacteriota bacterium]|jgi:large subunit ribosomal protein L3
MLGIIGQKLGMTQVFDDKGEAVPATVIEAGPCPIVQVKTIEKDGYAAVQLGFGKKREKNLSKPVVGHFKKTGTAVKRLLREFRTEDPSAFSAGQEIKVDQFEPGLVVDVVATSIGRGFQGTRKRHGFTGGRATHGCTTHDQPGSIGASAFPSRVIKGKRLPGRMGGKRVTVRNLTVVAVDPEQSLLVVRGAIPGPVRGFVLVRPAKKA